MLVYWIMKLSTETVLHYSLFVSWTLPNMREARFCTSKFKTYSKQTPQIAEFFGYCALTYGLSLSLSPHRHDSRRDTHYTSALRNKIKKKFIFNTKTKHQITGCHMSHRILSVGFTLQSDPATCGTNYMEQNP
jgi:hypothetical protein